MITITACIGSSCHLKGSYDIVSELQKLIAAYDLGSKVTIKASFCLGNCTQGVCVKVDDSPVISVKKENVLNFFDECIIKNL